MTQRISFFTYSEWDSDRACMAFIALIDGRRARCLIRSEAIVELAQKDAGSPILSFAQSRQGVEDLARALIQDGRLDGDELVIRLSDVLERRISPTSVSIPADSISTRSVHADGGQISMSDVDREQIWRAICDRQRLACSTASASIAGRARIELLAFENSAVPTTAHELNLRRVEAARMSASWRAESSSVEGAVTLA